MNFTWHVHGECFVLQALCEVSNIVTDVCQFVMIGWLSISLVGFVYVAVIGKLLNVFSDFFQH